MGMAIGRIHLLLFYWSNMSCHVARHMSGRPCLNFPNGIMYRRSMDIDMSTVELEEGELEHIERMRGSMGNQVVTFADADFARDVDQRKSTTGFIVYLNGGPVAWRSQLQKSVALSTMDAETFAVSEGTRTTVYVVNLLAEMGIDQLKEVPMYTDNMATQMTLASGSFPPKAKHIAVRHFYIKELIQEKLMAIFYCPTHWMPADLLTKPLPAPAVRRMQPYAMGWWHYIGGMFSPTGGALRSTGVAVNATIVEWL